MAPSYEDLPYDFTDIVKRRLEGETYMKLTSELGISSGKIVELIDEYRKRVVPLAMKWDEWRQGKEQPKQEAKEEPKAETEESLRRVNQKTREKTKKSNKMVLRKTANTGVQSV